MAPRYHPFPGPWWILRPSFYLLVCHRRRILRPRARRLVSTTCFGTDFRPRHSCNKPAAFFFELSKCWLLRWRSMRIRQRQRTRFQPQSPVSAGESALALFTVIVSALQCKGPSTFSEVLFVTSCYWAEPPQGQAVAGPTWIACVRVESVFFSNARAAQRKSWRRAAISPLRIQVGGSTGSL